jgi:DNA polymerase III delta prime subunit
MKKVWPEAYRPSSIDDVVFSTPQERAHFTRFVKDGEIPSLLLVGYQGTGKTSVSLALMHDLKVDPSDVLKINCSSEQIEAIREKVETFAYTMPLGKFKVVRLEEMDYLSLPAQALLRTLIQDVEGSCRFIGTANYQNKIMPPLQDRFQIYQFNTPNRDEVLVRAADVLDKEKVEYEVDDLLKVIEAGYPSVRRVLTLLEQSSKSGKLVITGAESVADWKLQLLPLLEQGDWATARQLVCSSASREELQDVYRFLCTNLHRVKGLAKRWDEAYVMIAEYQRWHTMVADVEIHVAALFIDLGMLKE